MKNSRKSLPPTLPRKLGQFFKTLIKALKLLRKDEDESFDEFYVKLKDIVNSTFNLGE